MRTTRYVDDTTVLAEALEPNGSSSCATVGSTCPNGSSGSTSRCPAIRSWRDGPPRQPVASKIQTVCLRVSP